MRKWICNEQGDLSFATGFIIIGLVILTAFLLLFASVKINSINIRNGVKMELNNLTATIYADTYHSQREANMGDYLSTLYSSSDYTRQLEEMVEEGLRNKVPLETDDYRLRNIHLKFEHDANGIEYTFSCDAEFYIHMFGDRYPAITQHIELSGHHNTKF